MKVITHPKGVAAIAASPDGAWYASCGGDRRLHLWNAKTGIARASVAGTDRSHHSLAITPDSRFVLVGGHAVQIYEVAKKKRVGDLPVKKPLVVALAATNDVVLLGDDRKPRRFALATRKELAPLAGHQSRIDACALSDDGAFAITCGGDRKIKVHALLGKKPVVVAQLVGYAKACGFVEGAAWSAGWDHAHVFDPKTGNVSWAAPTPLRKARVGALSRDGCRFAIAHDVEVLVYALPSRKPRYRLDAANVGAMAFDANGHLLVAESGWSSERNVIDVFDVAKQRRLS